MGRHVLRNFGKHGVHKETIVSYDEDGELTFRVDYLDGDYEDLSQEEVEATLVPLPSAGVSGKRRVVRVTARTRRVKEKDDSESDYIEEENNSSDDDLPPSSQATTQPFDFTVSTEPSQPGPSVGTSTSTTAIRRRSVPSVRQSNVPLALCGACPSSICVHYNAVDRGLCAQTLREHHIVLERAMVRVFPRFKWGKSHYLQVTIRILITAQNTIYRLLYNTHQYCTLHHK